MVLRYYKIILTTLVVLAIGAGNLACVCPASANAVAAINSAHQSAGHSHHESSLLVSVADEAQSNVPCSDDCEHCNVVRWLKSAKSSALDMAIQLRQTSDAPMFFVGANFDPHLSGTGSGLVPMQRRHTPQISSPVKLKIRLLI